MNARKYILEKQIQWAMNQNIELIGSKGNRGQQAYTSQLNANIFEPLSPDARKSFEGGDGNEINGSLDSPAKMQALHSSSALGVNIFHYWQRIKQVPLIAAACGFCQKGNNASQKIVFEDKYPIDNMFKYAPNIDVVIYNSDTAKVKRFAVECKFSEAYGGRGHSGLDRKYIKIRDSARFCKRQFTVHGCQLTGFRGQYLHLSHITKSYPSFAITLFNLSTAR